ncbi:hypothetical protein ADMFC3_27220 [Geovibrio sp. ADMFC3]
MTASTLIQKTYGRLIYNNGWEIREAAPHVSIKLKNLFRKIPEYAVPPYCLADTHEIAADLCWFIQRYPFQMSDSDYMLLKQNSDAYERNIAESEQILLPNWEPMYSSALLKGTPRHYQEQFAQIILKHYVAICGDDVGLGKTYAGVTTLCSGEMLPAAVVVQTHNQKQWKEKIEDFSHLRAHIVKSKKPYNLPPADVYIFKYTSLAGWTDIFAKGIFKAVIFDEIQELRTGTKSDKGVAASILCRHVTYKIGLSASPIYNYAAEIWNIYDILHEGSLFSYGEFMREWFNGYKDKDGKALCSDPQALGSYLRERYLLIRRTREEVGRELPPLSTAIYTVDYDEAAVASHEDMLKKLAQKTLYAEQFFERGQSGRELDMRLRQITGISKARYVAEFVKVMLDNNEPVLLAGWHREVYNIWLEALKDYKPMMYTGSETPKQKEIAKKAFISGETNLLIISLRSGVGIDGFQFNRCSTAVFGELDWSPEVHNQVTGRLRRDGQEKKILQVFLLSEYGSDPVITDVLGIKASQSDGVLNPERSILKTTNFDDSRVQMLARKILNEKKNQ